MADQPSPRRRFQFRLRTLLIVVTLLSVPCAYIGRQARVVAERRAWLAAHPISQRDQLWDSLDCLITLGDQTEYPSLVRRWIGDEAIRILFVGQSDAETAEALFPEAAVCAHR
jgi:hypothetical protein